MKKRVIRVLLGIAIYILLLCILTIVESENPVSSINSFMDAFWYSIVTFSTVGYGDSFPVSIIGKIIGVIFIIFSVGFLGIVIGKITNLFEKIAEKRRLGLMGTDFKNHIVIIGWDSFAEDITNQLINANKKVAIITNDRNEIDNIHQKFSQDKVFACFLELNNVESFNLVNMQDATTVYLNFGTDSSKLISIINLRKLYINTEIVVELEDATLTETFKNAGVTYVLSKNEIASKLIASYIFEPIVAEFTKDLVSATDDKIDYDIQQYRIISGNKFINKTYGEMFRMLKNVYNIITIGLYKSKRDELLKLPDDEEIIEENDYILVIANGEMEKSISNLFMVSEGK